MIALSIITFLAIILGFSFGFYIGKEKQLPSLQPVIKQLKKLRSTKRSVIARSDEELYDLEQRQEAKQDERTKREHYGL